MTPRDLIADLRSRINPAYSAQRGTESYERRLCAEALESLLSEIVILRTGDTCARQCEGTAYRIELRKTLESIRRCYQMLLTEPDTKGALFKAENILRGILADGNA